MSGFKSQIHSLWGELPNFFVLQFLYMVHGNKNSAHPFGWMSGLNELIDVKCFKHGKAQSKCQKNTKIFFQLSVMASKCQRINQVIP